MKPVFQKLVLGKYTVTYFYCEQSGFLKTESPYWLNESYQSAIALTDTGLVHRNLTNSHWLTVALELLFLGKGKYLDIAGGYGLLARLMRDRGFDFYTTDKYCNNIFASSFEPDKSFTADALFAFEVLEHIEDPVSFLSDIFSTYACKTLFFSTLTFQNDSLPPTEWWYFSCETGQHISFYQPKALRSLAKLFGLNYYSFSPSLHLITDLRVSIIFKKVLSNNKLVFLLHAIYRSMHSARSKTWKDHLFLTEQLKNRGE